ncbi:MAG: serine hydrolase domain-containing protein [Planctomycetaceae bacterium]
MNAAVATALLAWSAAAPVEAPYPVEAIVRRHAERFVEGRPQRAIVIGVTSNGRRRVWGFGGFERYGERVVPDAKTVYEIGSITKTFTGTILADLVQSGTLRLDDPVQGLLPDDWSMPTRDDRDVSLLHLATHTSSLPRMPPGFGAFMLLTGTGDDPYSEFRDENLKVTLTQIELTRPIGSRFEYSNLGMGLLGQALARAAHQPDVDSLFAKRLLEPLALTDTTFTPTAEQQSRLAPPFDDGTAAQTWHFDSLKACGGLRSTADDMLAYAEAAMNRKASPLRPAFKLAMEPWRQTCIDQRSIGLGWFVQPMPMPAGVPRAPATRLVWHGGATGGYRTFLGLMPERNSAIIVLSNSTAEIDPALTWPVMHALLREIGEP